MNQGGLLFQIKKYLQANKKPDLSKIPTALKHVIGGCFEYEPHKRVKITTLLDLYQCVMNEPAEDC